MWRNRCTPQATAVKLAQANSEAYSPDGSDKVSRNGMRFLTYFSCTNLFAFLFASQKIRGYSPLKIPRQHF